DTKTKGGGGNEGKLYQDGADPSCRPSGGRGDVIVRGCEPATFSNFTPALQKPFRLDELTSRTKQLDTSHCDVIPHLDWCSCVVDVL
ncbi:Argininosuccinate synthase, partial [Dissostichus eleginoides]